MAIKGSNRGKAYTQRTFMAMKHLILLRDDCTCYMCRKVNPSNEVHHVDHDNQNNHPNNLMVLCKSCHATITRSKFVFTNFIEDKKFEIQQAIVKYFNLVQNSL